MRLWLRWSLGLVSVCSATIAVTGLVFFKVIVGTPVVSTVVDLFRLDPFARLGPVDVGLVSVVG